MTDVIQLLPEHVANQIAAGEVVQRPASVVKELLENSLDAGADTIKLLLKDAGKTLIQVIDNGKGMSSTDARMSFERHATSKIKKTEDLFAIQTKGFRGEALASIAAVAQVELKTSRAKDDLGTRIVIEGSEIKEQEPVVQPVGTSIAVKNLFFNIPARRNFLKSDAIETRHMVDELQRIALSNPQVTFYMYHNDSEVYHLPEANLKKRIVDIMGTKINEKLVPIKEQTDIVSLSGYIVKSEFAKKKRGDQFLFVNNRFVKSHYLNHAIKTAYEGLISDKQHPGYILFLKVPPDSIDINIHPTKTEIKFENEHDLYAILFATVKHSLGQYQVAPALDFNRDPSLDLPYHYKDKLPHKEPDVKVDRSYNPFVTQKPKENWENLYADIPDMAARIEVIPEEQEMQTHFEENIAKGQKTQQLQNKYIVSTIKSGLVFIHQNRAHQRILYERFVEQISHGTLQSQQLLFPMQLDFDPSDILILKEMVEDLMGSGFTFETIKENYLVINGLPPEMEENNLSEFFELLIEGTKDGTLNKPISQLDFIAKNLAKNAAVKIGQPLTPEAQEELVDNLFNCEEPKLSPFGKTCFTTLTTDEIDKRL
jgi:DNA mismatch repair protein MutL